MQKGKESFDRCKERNKNEDDDIKNVIAPPDLLCLDGRSNILPGKWHCDFTLGSAD